MMSSKWPDSIGIGGRFASEQVAGFNRNARPLSSGFHKLTVPVEKIAAKILLLRGQRIMLDHDLVKLYRAPTKALNQAVKRETIPSRFYVP